MGVFDRWIGGPQGGGFFDFLAKGGGFFAPLAGGAGFFSFLGEAGEGGSVFTSFHVGGDLFSKATKIAGEWFDVNVFEKIFETVTGKTASWKGLTAEGKKAVMNVAAGHVFIGEQLEKYKNVAAIQPIWKEYKELGTALPDKALMDKILKKLGRALHSDRHGGDRTLFQAFGHAQDSLLNPDNRAIYESTLRDNKDLVDGLFAEMGKNPNLWKTAASQAPHVERLQLGGDEPKKLSGLRGWFADLSPNRKTALVFGAGAAVVVGGYFTLKAIDNWRQKEKKKDKAFSEEVHHSKTGPMVVGAR